jgi:hypothetical protein
MLSDPLAKREARGAGGKAGRAGGGSPLLQAQPKPGDTGTGAAERLPCERRGAAVPQERQKKPESARPRRARYIYI